MVVLFYLFSDTLEADKEEKERRLPMSLPPPTLFFFPILVVVPVEAAALEGLRRAFFLTFRTPRLPTLLALMKLEPRPAAEEALGDGEEAVFFFGSFFFSSSPLFFTFLAVVVAVLL